MIIDLVTHRSFGQNQNDQEEALLEEAKVSLSLYSYFENFRVVGIISNYLLGYDDSLDLFRSTGHRSRIGDLNGVFSTNIPPLPEFRIQSRLLLNCSVLSRGSAATVSNSSQNLDGTQILEALQSEAAFTTAADRKPILATYGCGPCVALAGYDPTNKAAFVVHFSNAREVRAASGMLFYNLSKLVKEKLQMPIQLHLRGGVRGQSEAIIKAIKIWMRQREDLPMKIISKDVLDSIIGKSIMIDARDGSVSEYDPLSNPLHRNITPLDAIAALMSAYTPHIRLVDRFKNP